MLSRFEVRRFRLTAVLENLTFSLFTDILGDSGRNFSENSRNYVFREGFTSKLGANLMAIRQSTAEMRCLQQSMIGHFTISRGIF